MQDLRPVALITGASSGIGAAFARRLAPTTDLILVARRKELLDRLADEFGQAYGTRVEPLAADLANESDLARVADRLAEEPRLTLLVNNAGFGVRGRFWQVDAGEYERMHRVHVMATLRLSHAALRNLVPRDAGAVINVASVSAYLRMPGGVCYSATKSWMTVFTEGLYLELKGAGSQVAVQALCPGYTYSEFHDALPVPRERLAPRSFWMTAEEVVDASLTGLARRKLFVVPGWRYRIVTSLLSVLPESARLAFEMLAARSGPARLFTQSRDLAGEGRTLPPAETGS